MIKKSNLQLFLKVIILTIFPLFCVIGICIYHGKSFSDLYIPCSEWNDEMVYYKLTESVIDYGIPQGFFGFNESHGIYLSFASWSPFLLLPWVVWGKIFGWNILSPIICNIVLLSMAFLIITLILRPSWKQVMFIVLCFSFCSHFTRFIISCMSEVTVWSFSLIVFSLFVLDSKKKSNRALVIAIFILAVLCLMRPYFVIFFIYPLVRLKKCESKLFFISAGSLVITIILYYLVNHYLSAPYLEDLYYTDWIHSFKNGLFYGVQYTASKMIKSFVSILNLIEKCVIGNNTSGALYAVFFICLLIQLIHLVLVIRQKEKDIMMLDIQVLLASLLFFIAVLLMYRLPEGGRHVLPYVFIIILNVGINRLSNKQLLFQAVVIIAVFYFFFNIRAVSEFDYKIPFKENDVYNELEDLKRALKREIIVLDEDNPSYINTIIWVFSDNVDGIDTRVAFRQFYSVPPGIGLNLCYGQYVLDNIDSINSRYIGTIPDGDIDILLKKYGKRVIAQNESIIVYELY